MYKLTSAEISTDSLSTYLQVDFPNAGIYIFPELIF